MHGRAATLLATLAIAATACGAPAAADPYDLIVQSTKATWSPIQVNVGIKATTRGAAITLDPSNIAIVVDEAAGKGALHIAIPAAGLGIPPAALGQLGIDGGSLDFDVVDDGTALYLKSAFMKPVLQMLLGRTGKLPAGDLSGWLKLATNEELTALALAGAGGALPSAAAPSPPTEGAMKESLATAGVTLGGGATEKRNGVDAQHVTVAIDTAKMATNPDFLRGAGPQGAKSAAMIKAVTLSGDLWFDPGSHRLVEIDVHVASATGGPDSADLTITMHDPDGSVALDTPPSSIPVPLSDLITQMMRLISTTIES